MPFAFGHLIGAWLLGKAYEYATKDVTRKKISRQAWFFLLLGSILPDADFLLDWVFGTEIHRTFTHSLLFVIAAPLVLYLALRMYLVLRPYLALNFYLRNWHLNAAFRAPPCALAFAGALAGGILSHLLLDMIGAGLPLLWPSLLHISYTSVHYAEPSEISLFMPQVAWLHRRLQLAIVDMALGTAWIFYLWWKKRLEF